MTLILGVREMEITSCERIKNEILWKLLFVLVWVVEFFYYFFNVWIRFVIFSFIVIFLIELYFSILRQIKGCSILLFNVNYIFKGFMTKLFEDMFLCWWFLFLMLKMEWDSVGILFAIFLFSLIFLKFLL